MTTLTLLGEHTTEAHESLPHLPVSIEDMIADGVEMYDSMQASLEDQSLVEIEEEVN